MRGWSVFIVRNSALIIVEIWARIFGMSIVCHTISIYNFWSTVDLLMSMIMQMWVTFYDLSFLEFFNMKQFTLILVPCLQDFDVNWVIYLRNFSSKVVYIYPAQPNFTQIYTF